MSTPRFKKDKEIIAEYESQVKGKEGGGGSTCVHGALWGSGVTGGRGRRWGPSQWDLKKKKKKFTNDPPGGVSRRVLDHIWV